MKKKILFLIPDLRNGGAESVFVQLANYFLYKFDIYFMVLKAEGPNINKLNKKIKIIELKKNSSIKTIFKINKFIKKNKIDVAIGSLAMAYALSIANLFGRKKCNYISRIGSIISENLNRFNFIKKIIFLLYQKVLYFSDTIITQSVSMDKDLKKYIKKKNKHNLQSYLKKKNFDPFKKERVTYNIK